MEAFRMAVANGDSRALTITSTLVPLGKEWNQMRLQQGVA